MRQVQVQIQKQKPKASKIEIKPIEEIAEKDNLEIIITKEEIKSRSRQATD
ncbi:MAG: hypothetical protein Q6363_008115 [Candidatus Njordarchaeota archaeon]